MRLAKIVFLSAVTAASAAGCNKSASDSKQQPVGEGEASDTSEGGAEGTDGGGQAGTVAITTTDKALLYVQAALASSAEVSSEISATKAGTVAVAALTEESDPNCYHGTPRNDAETVYTMPGDGARPGEVNERAPYYASGLWYCHLKNVIPGAFSTPTAFTCAVGDLPYDGSVTDKEMTLNVAGSSCFAGMLEGEAPATIVAKVSALPLSAEEHGFDRQLKIAVAAGQVGDEAIEINVRLKLTDKSIAFATWQHEGGKKFATAARLDTDTGTMRFIEIEDTLTPESTAQEDRIRNTRIFLKGTLDENGKYSVITRMEGLKGELFFKKNTNSYSTRFVSMAGNVADGVKTKNYGAPLGSTEMGTILPLSIIPDLDNYDWPDGVNSGGVLRSEPLPGCFGAAGVKCTGNEGIPLTEANYQKLFLFPKAEFPAAPLSLDPTAWAQTKAAFLSFDEGGLADSL